MASLVPTSAKLGAIALVILGGLHGAGTLVDNFAPVLTRPPQAGVVELLASAPTSIGARIGQPRLTVWSGHLGWNFSHSLGLVFAGLVGLVAGHSRAVLTAVAIAATVWLAFSASFWFWGPTVGLAVATVALLAARANPAVGSGTKRPIPRGLYATIPMLLAGGSHLLATIPELAGPGLFMPLDEVARAAMSDATMSLPVRLGSSRSFAEAYIGFNFSHGWAVVLFVTLTGIVARTAEPDAVRTVLKIASVVALLYAAVSIFYWFWLPAIACVLATAGLSHAALGPSPRATTGWARGGSR